MKLPNGFGSVYRLSGKRRKPWIAVITIGFDDNGKQIRKAIGCSETKAGAIQLLVEYHKNPYDIDVGKLTFEEIFYKWFDWKFDKKEDLSTKKKSMSRYQNAFKYFKDFHKKQFVDINMFVVQDIIDKCEYGYSIKSDIKSLYCQLYDYGKLFNLPLCNLVKKNIKIGKYQKSDLHIPFTEEEIEILWNNVSVPNVDLILIGIYTGQRPGELVDPTEICIEDKYIISGIKTEAGIDRTIPLHEKIIPLYIKRFVENQKRLTYRQYRKLFKNIMELLGMSHTPHDTRHTFATRADQVKMNAICKKLILGHEIQDITDGVYTHKTIKDLLEAVNLLK